MDLQAPGLGMGLLLGAILIVGNALALVSIRLAIAGTMSPDTYGGIRTAATRSSDAAWLAAHRAAWPWALALHGLAIVAGIAAACLGTTVGPFLVAASTSVIATALGAIAQLVVGNAAAKRLLDA